MSRVPMGSDGKDFSPRLLARFNLVWQGISAEMIAERWHLSRTDLDEFSLASHKRALSAAETGRFKKEIIPIAVASNGTSFDFTSDEGPRTDTSLDKLACLQPAFKEDGVITAGNASQMSDGAAAVLLMEAGKARGLGLTARARIVSRVSVGSDPILMLDGIIPATKKALKKAGLDVDEVDLFEVNEAFAAPVLAWLKEIDADPERVNPNGGAIALGHPLGASGSRIMTTMLNELERREARYGLQTMCIGHGMATATIIERLDS